MLPESPFLVLHNACSTESLSSVTTQCLAFSALCYAASLRCFLFCLTRVSLVESFCSSCGLKHGRVQPAQLPFRISCFTPRRSEMACHLMAWDAMLGSASGRANGRGAVWAKSGHLARYSYDMSLASLGTGEGERANTSAGSRA